LAQNEWHSGVLSTAYIFYLLWFLPLFIKNWPKSCKLVR
jgi:hypothetical protein